MSEPRAGCTFCRIASGDLPGFVVFEDAHTFAFLDTRPLFHGHTLVVPRAHHETLSDLPPERVGPLFEIVQRLARGVERAMEAPGSFVALNNRVSQSVPHLHVHIVPRRPKDGLRGFFWPRMRYESDAQMASVRDAIRAALEGA